MLTFGERRRTALGEQAAADDRVVAALTKAVADSDAEVRHASLSALGEIGPAAKASLPALESIAGRIRNCRCACEQRWQSKKSTRRT